MSKPFPSKAERKSPRTLDLGKLPPELTAWIKQAAIENERSMIGQVRYILKRAFDAELPL